MAADKEKPQTEPEQASGASSSALPGPRRDADVLREKELTPDQKDAAERVHSLLRELSEIPWEPRRTSKPAHGYLPDIDERRHSAVFLIDGGRGTGKTALLVSLLRCWRNWVERPSTKDAERDEGSRDERPGLERLLGHMWTRRIVPVGLLDLHPLPSTTNLPLFLAGCFLHVVEGLEARGIRREEGGRPPPWQALEDDDLECTKNWQRFLRAMAAGWDRNMKARNATLDLDAYMLELEQTERERLDVRSCFSRFIDSLVEDYRRIERQKDPPLFVVAVDDADMTPHMTIELLSVLRVLYHPRVAFLLTGDSDLFLTMLSDNFLGTFLSQLQGTAASLQDAMSHGVHPRAEEAAALAHEYYNKLVPLQHRCVLGPLDPRERFMGERVDVRGALERVHVREGEKAPTLAHYLDIEHQTREALPERLRGLIELREYVYLKRRGNGGKHASRVVEKLWHDALRQWPRLRDDRWEEVVTANESNGALVIEIPAGLESSFQLKKIDGALVPEEDDKRPQRRLRFEAIPRFEVRIRRGARLSPQMVATLMLAANVAADQPEGHIDYAVGEAPQSSPAAFEPRFAVVDYVRAQGEAPLHFGWPLPAWRPFPGFAVFSSRWRDIVNKHREREQRKAGEDAKVNGYVDALALYFLDIVLRFGGDVTDTAEPTWESLAKQVAQIATAGDPHRSTGLRQQWAIHCAGLLAAPEAGLTDKAAKEWLEALERELGDGSWPEVKRRIGAERRARVMQALGSNATPEQVQAFIDEADEAFHNHPWTLRVEDRPERQRQKLFTIFRDHLKLASYLTTPVQAMLNEAPPELVDALIERGAEYMSSPGSIPHALAGLWTTAIMDYKDVAADLADTVRPGERNVIVEHLEPGRQPRGKPFFDLPINGHGHVRVWTSTVVPVYVGTKELPAPLHALYKMASALVSAPTAQDELKISWFPAVYCLLGPPIDDGQPPGFRWPEVSWERWEHRSAFDLAWVRVMALAEKLEDPRRRIDALAYWLLEASRVFSGGNEVTLQDLPVRGDLDPKDWSDLATTIERSLGMDEDVDKDAWRRAVPLMAAPESGLSKEAAAGLLDGFKLAMRERSRGERFSALVGPSAQPDFVSPAASRYQDVRALRLERAVSAGIPRAGAEAFLAQHIDGSEAFKDHPWVATPELSLAQERA